MKVVPSKKSRKTGRKIHGSGRSSRSFYDELVFKYGSTCAICGTLETELNKRLSVDHCHTTNEIRGLLCTNCNIGLGMFKDNPELLDHAQRYLRLPPTKRQD